MPRMRVWNSLFHITMIIFSRCTRVRMQNSSMADALWVPPPLPSLVQAWLNAKIHRVGSLYNSGDELMRAATGSELDPAIFLAYLKSKYTELYKL